MELAKLVLEFLKVLLWPVVLLIVLLIFKSHLERFFRQFSDRVSTAETLKLGVMGQEVQISGTAKELAKERARLAQSSDQTSTGKLEAIDQAAQQLKNPMVDLIGIKLFKTIGAVRIEHLVHAILAAISPDKPPAEMPPMVIMSVTREVEKLLDTLQTIGYAKGEHDTYELTDAGRRFFQRVEDDQSGFLARFKALK